MKRITEKFLNARVALLNFTFKKKGHYDEKGAFVLSHAHGGVSLHRYTGNYGAVSDVFNCGHIPKRQLNDLIGAYLVGIGDAVELY